MIANDAVIDVCAFHEWSTVTTLTPYMSRGWRELLERSFDPVGPANIKSRPLFRDPRGSKAAEAYPSVGLPGSDFAILKEHLLDGGERSQLVLSYDEGALATSFPNHYVAHEAATAANRWTEEEWLARDARLCSLITVSTSLPGEAADEVRRAGANGQMVGVLMGANALGKPFGHPLYHPIYEAAEDVGLGIVIGLGSDATADLFTAPAAGGPIGSYGEFRALESPVIESHVSSLILQGVFEKYPRLKVLIVGGGGAWIPPYLWRIDYLYNATPHEVPWLTKLPSAYFLEHVRVTTYGLESPARATALTQAIGAFEGLDSLFTYASGYPNADWQEPSAAAAALPEVFSPETSDAAARDVFPRLRPPSEIDGHARKVDAIGER